ncbi:MAG TPA: hypothetical protein VJS90_05355 [Pseudomonas sp.]|uniref:hypothetical protein n=1 Tax=Pseudomonas sp. TaxID=306 RepID=UPI002B482523|nr:hypothetical protein [Pseudomonas sp.]HKS12447.1 hypothetical protein [Pseudomonas sp.]
MDANKNREQFEAAYVEEMAKCCGEDIRQRARANLAWRQENGDYRDPMVRLAYWAWKASREAVVVELPAEWATNVGTMLPPPGVRRAIEAQGLKVAP